MLPWSESPEHISSADRVPNKCKWWSHRVKRLHLVDKVDETFITDHSVTREGRQGFQVRTLAGVIAVGATGELCSQVRRTKLMS
jgi:hypothetical protein